MADSVERALLSHAAALRGLARDLVGAQHAEDVVQATALEALRKPPRHPGPLGGWLATVVRRVAGHHLRGERRRQQRERLAARPESVLPEPGNEQRELFRRLNDAVLALPEPYQQTVLLRYFGGLPPMAIAERLGVPVATVKTRLQRGIGLLRSRLDADGTAADWRVALGVLFGTRETLQAAVTAAGVVVMGTGTKALVAVAAVLVAVLAWWWNGREEAVPPPSTPQVTDVGPVPSGAEPSATDGTAPQRVGLAAPGVAVVAVAADRALIRGRCIDELGRPVAGCFVSFRGWHGDGAQRDYALEYGSWLLAHPDSFVADATAMTGGDGVFVFTLPWAPLGFELTLRRDAFDHVLQHEPPLRGAVTELGDLRVPTTTMVRGRIVDTAGAAVTRVVCHLLLSADEASPSAQPAVRGALPMSDAEGNFAVALPAASQWRVQVLGRELLRPAELRIEPALTVMTTELVVRAIEEVETISGIVVDDAGQPVADADITYFSSMLGMPARSDAQGVFVFTRQKRGVGREAWLNVGKAGFSRRSVLAVEWGTSDVRVDLQRLGTRIELLAHTDTGVPVTDYRVWVLPAPDRSTAPPPLVRGHHPGGRSVLPQVPRGWLRIALVPDRADLALAIVPVTVDDEPVVHAEVVVPPAGERALRVLGADGAPRQGIGVDLVDGVGRAFGPADDVEPVARWQTSKALLLQRGRTDAQGELLLRGPVRPLFVRVSGPGVVPLVVPAELGAAEPLVVTLPAAARIEGKLGPAALVRDLRNSSGLPEVGPQETARSGAWCLTLSRLENGKPTGSLWLDPGIAPASDGSFAFDALPEGGVQVVLGGPASDIDVLATVDVRAGQAHRVDLDGTRFARGELRGRLFKDGNPVRREMFLVSVQSSTHPAPLVHSHMTDDQGAFSIRLRAGTAQLVLLHNVESPDGLTVVEQRSAESVVVPPGGSVVQDFHVDTGSLRVCVLLPDGKPAVGLVLRLVDVSGRGVEIAATDGSGIARGEVTVGDYTLQVLPRRLQSIRARSELIRQLGGNRPGVLDSYRLTLGPLAVRAEAGAETTITLPAEFER